MHTDSSCKSPKFQTVSREAFWRRHVEQWRTSGLSKTAYCQQYALTYHQMVYWSKKEEACAEPEPRSGGFVAVSVSADAGDYGLSLRLPNGMTIEGINNRSIELVGKLVSQL